ncbi:hypothetical protein [Nonomuraea sp. SYSU D8015]|nr:hypothetical protein [Nonomuraea sp. SYSU D8015]
MCHYGQLIRTGNLLTWKPGECARRLPAHRRLVLQGVDGLLV